MHGLFYNTRAAQCSIYESGLMSYRALVLSTKYSIEYRELPASLHEDVDKFDFIVFNWHHVTFAATQESLAHLRQPKYTIVTECAPEDPIIWAPRWFDGYLVLDPTVADSGNIYGMPRPLDIYTPKERIASDTPIIGSFGLATPGKRFDLIAQEVINNFSKALVRFNIPAGTHCTPNVQLALADQLRSMSTENINVQVTHEYFTNEQLIDWCGYNDLNVFFYYRKIPGLSAVTDQAVSSQQPLLVSDDYTFRHIHKYMLSYPTLSIKDALNTKELVRQIYNDWHPQKFAEKFERILAIG